MKRKISFLLALAMLLTFIPFSSFAEENYDKQLKEAIIKSKELFNIGKEYDKFSHSVNTYDGKTTFYLNWSDSKGKLGSIDVSIAVDGTVINYGKWRPRTGEQKPKLPKVSKEEGLKKAQDFIKKVSPKFVGNIKYIDRPEPLNVNSDGYNYNFVRIENGIPYYNNSINVYVDNFTGEVRSYNTNWDMDLVFSDSKDIISLEKAEGLYKEKIGLDLLYKSAYVGEKRKTYLAYGPLNMSLGIDAKDGKVAPLYDYGFYEKSMDMGNRGGDAEPEELNPDEEKAVEDISGLISQNEAEKAGREILGLDSEFKLEYINLYNNWGYDGDYSWNMDFRKGSYPKEQYVNLRIDAKTKEIQSLYRYGSDDPDNKVQYNEEQALDIAKKYINKMNPDKYKLVELREDFGNQERLEGERAYNFNFIRKIDNAYVENDGISITVDVTNGNIMDYRINWNKGEFPPKDNIISVDKAYDKLFNDIGMELKYTSTYGGRDSKEQKKAVLVYGLKNDKPAIIDAKTGTILNSRGEPFKSLAVVSYKDIDKSYAKEKINILAQYGIALPGEEFKPKEKINQKDFLYLLAKANNPYYDYLDNIGGNHYNYLINIGILKEDEQAPEKIVTKEEGIKYIIRALKYDKVADVSEIYKDLFKDTKDIDPKLKGYVSIAYGLKIVEGDNGYLNPKGELKREDAANMIYNYLFSGH